MMFVRTAAATLLLGSALAAAAVPLKTVPAQSSVTASFRQMNVPVEAKFNKFNAQVEYDAQRPDAAKARVDIDTASLDLGDAEMNREVAKKEWFNAAQFPKASFVSTAIHSTGPGQLAVTGQLTIKGKTADVSFALRQKAQGGKQVFEGQLPIKRLAFNIGEGEWKDTSMVADEVVIKFRITAAP